MEIPTCWIVLVSLLSILALGHAESSVGSRYSFSLTTFDPSGKLGQVDRAVEAAAMGPPIVAVVVRNRNEIVLAAPHRLPSPLMKDDGTSRFVRLSRELVVGHTGVSADGRILCAAAHQLALNHVYTFQEDISIQAFLRGMSSLMQEYTMKPGRRPFGSTLVVAHVPRQRQRPKEADSEHAAGTKRPQLFRIDPSGSVTKLDDCCIINGRGEDTDQLERRLATAADDKQEDVHQLVADWCHQQLVAQAKKQRLEELSIAPETVLVASATMDGRFRQTKNGRSETSANDG